MLGELLLVVALLQSVPRNPTVIQFECEDHATDTGHEVDIVRVSDNAVVQTLDVGDPVSVGEVGGLPSVRVTLNVQPVAFGEYRFVVRATAGAVKSVDSAASELWLRAPGAPGKPRVP